MDKKGVWLYLFILLLSLTSIIIFKNAYYYFWIFLTILLLIKYRFPRDKNYLKSNIIRLTIICLFSYFIIIYSLGLITGFYKNIFNLSLIGIIKNISKPVILIICEEIIRYIYAKNCQNNNKGMYYILTLIFIFLNILMGFNKGMSSYEQIFIFICTIILPVISMQILCSYLTFNVSLIPSIMIRIVTTVYIYIIPILPSLGNYLTSIIGLFFPIVIYYLASKTIKYYDKGKRYIKSASIGLIFVPVGLVSLVVVVLTSGILNYQLVAIGSGSMEPIIYRGDAVIFEKEIDLDNIKIGDVVAYKKNNIIVVHRVVALNQETKIFKTKGDNNDDIDNYTISESELIGKVKYNIKYIGYPTVLLNERFG